MKNEIKRMQKLAGLLKENQDLGMGAPSADNEEMNEYNQDDKDSGSGEFDVYHQMSPDLQKAMDLIQKEWNDFKNDPRRRIDGKDLLKLKDAIIFHIKDSLTF